MDEEENAVKPTLGKIGEDVNPTPSKLLASEINKFHMVTPVKHDDAAPAAPPRAPTITFNINETGDKRSRMDKAMHSKQK